MITKAVLTAKARTRLKNVMKRSEALQVRRLDGASDRTSCHVFKRCSTTVLARSPFVMGRLNVAVYADWKKQQGDALRFLSYELDGTIVGFSAAFLNGRTGSMRTTWAWTMPTTNATPCTNACWWTTWSAPSSTRLRADHLRAHSRAGQEQPGCRAGGHVLPGAPPQPGGQQVGRSHPAQREAGPFELRDPFKRVTGIAWTP
jgi:hypothetical protein